MAEVEGVPKNQKPKKAIFLRPRSGEIGFLGCPQKPKPKKQSFEGPGLGELSFLGLVLFFLFLVSRKEPISPDPGPKKIIKIVLFLFLVLGTP